MVEGGDRRYILLSPVDGEIALVRHQAGQHVRADRSRIMRTIIGPLLALGQRRRDRKVEKRVVGRGNRTDRGEIRVKLAGQAEGGKDNITMRQWTATKPLRAMPLAVLARVRPFDLLRRRRSSRPIRWNQSCARPTRTLRRSFQTRASSSPMKCCCGA
jgi:hypothetical protein